MKRRSIQSFHRQTQGPSTASHEPRPAMAEPSPLIRMVRKSGSGGAASRVFPGVHSADCPSGSALPNRENATLGIGESTTVSQSPTAKIRESLTRQASAQSRESRRRLSLAPSRPAARRLGCGRDENCIRADKSPVRRADPIRLDLHHAEGIQYGHAWRKRAACAFRRKPAFSVGTSALLAAIAIQKGAPPGFSSLRRAFSASASSLPAAPPPTRTMRRGPSGRAASASRVSSLSRKVLIGLTAMP